MRVGGKWCMCSIVDLCGQFNPIKTSRSEVVQEVHLLATTIIVVNPKG